MASQIVSRLAQSRASEVIGSVNLSFLDRNFSSESDTIRATLFPDDGIGPEIAESVEQSIEIEKFDGKDYGFWRMRVEDYLHIVDLHQLLGTKPEKMDEAEWARLDRKVLGLIRLTLSKNVVHNVAKETTTAGMMKVLYDMYAMPSVNNKIFLMKKLFHLKMGEGASGATHVIEFSMIVNQLSLIGIEFDDEVRALILLDSLPNSWDSMKMAVSNYVCNEKMKFTDVRDRILAEDVRRINFWDTSPSSTLKAKNGDKNRDISYNRNKGRLKLRNNRDNSKLKQLECWNCGKTDHIKKNCQSPPKSNDRKMCGVNTVAEEIADAWL